MKIMHLFAGIEALDQALKKAFGNEIETVFVSEWDKYAQKTYKENFEDDFEIAGDITKIDENDIPKLYTCVA